MSKASSARYYQKKHKKDSKNVLLKISKSF